MELELKNGRYVNGKYQELSRVSGAEEILQRVLMRLKTRRGSFLPMPEYGSRLYLLHTVKPSKRESAAKQYITEALSDEKGLALEELSLCETAQGEILITMQLSCEGVSLSAQTAV